MKVAKIVEDPQFDPQLATVSFFVPGIPKPGGSKRPVRNQKTGQIYLIDDCKDNMSWRDSVTQAGIKAMAEQDLFTGQVILDIVFVFPRPKTHYNKKGILRKSVPIFHSVRPDTTKLIRSTEDALKAICWIDDARVVDQHAVKRYALKGMFEFPGAHITITGIGTPTIH